MLKNREEATAVFQETGLSEKKAKQIIAVMKSKGLDLQKFGSVVREMERWFKKNEMYKHINKMSQSVVSGVVDSYMALYSTNKIYSEPDAGAFVYYEIPSGKKVSSLKEGDTIDIQVMKTGKRNHAAYGKFSITESDLDEYKKHFDSNVRGIKIAIDEDHDPKHRALAFVEKLWKKGKALFGKLKITKLGEEILSKGSYAYFSPEVAFYYTDPATGKKYRNVLKGGGFTNRPFFKQMQGLMASESASGSGHAVIFKSSNPEQMKKFMELFQKFNDTPEEFSQEDQQEAVKLFNEMDDTQKQDPNLKVYFDSIQNATFDESGSEEDEPKEDEPKEDEPKDDTETPEEGGEDPKDGDPEPKEDEPKEDEPKDDTETPEKNEDVTIKASELDQYKNDQTELEKLRKEKAFSETLNKVNSMAFSEDKKQPGLILKDGQAKKIATFASRLTQGDQKLFFEILGSFKVNSKLFSEIGSSEDGGVDESTMSYDERLNSRAQAIEKKMTQEGKEVKFSECLGVAEDQLAKEGVTRED